MFDIHFTNYRTTEREKAQWTIKILSGTGLHVKRTRGFAQILDPARDRDGIKRLGVEVEPRGGRRLMDDHLLSARGEDRRRKSGLKLNLSKSHRP